MARFQVVTLVLYGPGSQIQKFSTCGYFDETEGLFNPRIKNSIEYSREVDCWVWGARGRRSPASIGSADLINTDGLIGQLLDDELRNVAGTIKRGYTDQDYADHEHVAYVVVDRPTAPDRHTIRLVFRDKGALLDVPAQSSMYGAIAQAPSLEGTPRPVCIGECEGVPLTQVNAALLDNDVHDEDPVDVTETTDQGVILEEGVRWEMSPAVGVFGPRRLTSVAGKQVSKVLGAGSGSTVYERLPDVIAYLLDRPESQVPSVDVEPYTVDLLDAATEYTLCRWWRDGSLISQIISEFLDSYTGWWFMDRLGLLRVGRLVDPEESSEASALELTRLNLLGDITCKLDEARGLTDSVGAERNWSPHGPGDVAPYVTASDPTRAERIQSPHQVRVGAGSFHPSYAHAVGAEALYTLLSAVVHAQTEADRLKALYAIERYFYRCSAALDGSLSYTLEPGDIVTVTDNRFGLNAKRLLVLGGRTRLLSRRTDLLLWGSAPS